MNRTYNKLAIKKLKEQLDDILINLTRLDDKKIKVALFLYKNKNSTFYKVINKIFEVEIGDNSINCLAALPLNTSVDAYDNSELMSYKLIIFEEYNEKVENFIKLIKGTDKNKLVEINPHIGIIIFYEELKDGDNLDYLYNIGVDFIAIKKMFFTSDENSVIKNLYYFVSNIIKLLLKSEIIKWFLDISREIAININGIYKDGYKIINNILYKDEILNKLILALGQLRKPQTKYDEKFEFSNSEYAFITYWSCLNDIMYDWFIEEKGNNQLKLKNNKIILANNEQNNHNDNNKIILHSYKVSKNDFPQNITKIIIGTDLKMISNLYIYTTASFNSECNKLNEERIKDLKYPSVRIPALIASLVPEKIEYLILFSYLNQMRNYSKFIHSDKKKEKNTDPRKYLYLCVNMINFLYILLNSKLKSIDYNKLKKIDNSIKYYLKFASNWDDVMFITGNIKNIDIESKEYNLILNIKRNNEEKEVKFKLNPHNSKVNDELKQKLKELKNGDFVQIYFDILSGYKEDNFFQFLIILDINKIS